MEFQKKEQLDYKAIVFKTLDSLREKSLIEFRPGQKRTILKGDWAETTTEEDSRKTFIQGVEFLSDFIIQEFDKKTLEEYEKIQMELKELKEKVNSKEMEKGDYVLDKLEIMRKLLRLMMKRLKETGYLKQKPLAG